MRQEILCAFPYFKNLLKNIWQLEYRKLIKRRNMKTYCHLDQPYSPSNLSSNMKTTSLGVGQHCRNAYLFVLTFLGYGIATREAPYFLLYAVSFFSSDVARMLPQIGIHHRYDTTRVSGLSSTRSSLPLSLLLTLPPLPPHPTPLLPPLPTPPPHPPLSLTQCVTNSLTHAIQLLHFSSDEEGSWS